MKELPDLEKLSHAQKDALIRELWAKLQVVEELEARLAKLEKGKRAKKTSRNSGLPPAKGFKSNRKGKGKSECRREASVGRAGGGRELSPNPDQVVVAKLSNCPHCGTSRDRLSEQLSAVYERIELPLVKPIVTRVERYGYRCRDCEHESKAPVPAGLEEGSPFGASVAAVVVYLRYAHAVSYPRLSALMEQLYGLKISEGGIANLLQRVHARLKAPVDNILTRLRSARVVCSDETGARVNGQNQWEWVFQNDQVCLHVIRPSRGKKVIDEVMDGHHPSIWVSDLFSSQKAHPAEQWQVCLAHQLRDCQYAIDCGDDLFAPIMKRLVLRAIALGRNRHHWAASTITKHRNSIHRSLDSILTLEPKVEEGQTLIRRYRKLKKELFLFLDVEGVPPTNNSSERALRPSVIFRKVTNGFRSDWGSELFSQVRSIIGTAQRQGIQAFDAISRSLTSSHNSWLLG